MTTRHRYKKSSRDGICDECGQGRAEDVHRMLTWTRARTGNWLTTNATRDGIYRCRESGGGWLPEVGQNPDWFTLDAPMSLAQAKDACERHRESL